MSRIAVKTIELAMNGAELIPRKSAVATLKYLGFTHRYSNKVHHRWVHKETGTIVQFTDRKGTDHLWGFQVKDFKNAVSTVLNKAREFKPTDHPVTIKPTEVIEINTKEVLHMTTAEAVQTPQEEKELVYISTKNFPMDIAELVLSYENKEIVGHDLCEMLNDSGYRTAKGRLFTANNAWSTLIDNPIYQKWRGANTKTDLENIASEVPIDPMAVLQSIQEIVDENQRLKERVIKLEAAIQEVGRLVLSTEVRSE